MRKLNAKYVVRGTRFGKRKDLRTFSQFKFANRFKNLIKVTGKVFPSKNVFKNIRIKKIRR